MLTALPSQSCSPEPPGRRLGPNCRAGGTFVTRGESCSRPGGTVVLEVNHVTTRTRRSMCYRWQLPTHIERRIPPGRHTGTDEVTLSAHAPEVSDVNGRRVVVAGCQLVRRGEGRFGGLS